ncbi:hypothetical protein EMIT0158MI4_50182 [Burkholderia ambifaria]
MHARRHRIDGSTEGVGRCHRHFTNCVSSHVRLRSTNETHPIRHVPAESKNLHTKKDPKLQAKSLI